jgi:4-hydroxy-4-methyl-2-oxoglutarate aldolase
MSMVFLRIYRPSADLVLAAQNCSVSDLHEALGPIKGRTSTMTPLMRPVTPGVRMAGPAITVRPAPGDNLMMHRGLSLAARGDVLVVAANDESGAQWGGLATLHAQRTGLAGVVVHGPVRDVDVISQQRFAVWCTSIAPAHPEKKGAGAVNVPVVCDGVLVNPGDLVVADGDGVIVLAREGAATAIAAARQRGQHERGAAERIAAGETLWQVHKLDQAYASCGIKEQDCAWEDRPPDRD